MRAPFICVVSAVLLLGGVSSQAQTVAAATTAAGAAVTTPAKEAVFTQEQLDQMLAPVALYPDPLLAQILMAATYPGEVAEAAAWSKAHPDAKGDEAVKQVASQAWDPSVQALVAFPQFLVTLGQDPAWVQRLGDAFLAQPEDVMTGVQRLRRQAQAAGNLSSNQYQTVTVQAAPAPAQSPTPTNSSSTIIIQPADPQVVYVPAYNPSTSYGTWAYPASPPVYYPPPPAYYPGQALVAGLAFGAGVAIVASLWGDCDWNNNDVDIDVNRYNSINVNNRISNDQNKWQHNAVHRDGVPYRDNRSREQYGRQLDGAAQREAYRGDSAERAQARDRARSSMDRHGIEQPATSNRQARDQVRAAQSAPTASHRSAGTDRGQVTARDTRASSPASNPERVNQRQSGTSQTRQVGQKTASTQRGAARSNAFAGARSPSQANSQANRGRASQVSAQRPSTARAAGHQVSRPSSPPSRQGGGRR